jgi:hypothetical protein
MVCIGQPKEQNIGCTVVSGGCVCRAPPLCFRCSLVPLVTDMARIGSVSRPVWRCRAYNYLSNTWRTALSWHW